MHCTTGIYYPEIFEIEDWIWEDGVGLNPDHEVITKAAGHGFLLKDLNPNHIGNGSLSRLKGGSDGVEGQAHIPDELDPLLSPRRPWPRETDLEDLAGLKVAKKVLHPSRVTNFVGRY